MEEAIETFSQSRSMFLLEALLRGNDSIEHTDPALKKMHQNQISAKTNNMDTNFLCFYTAKLSPV